MILNLNAVMSIIANVPAAIVSTVRLPTILPSPQLTPSQIAASRIVRRLHNYSSEGAEVFV
jgi:hypothetical protein